MQGTHVQALVREDPTCHGGTKPVHHNYWACALEPAGHNYWACALEPAGHNYWACVPQLLRPVHLQPMLCNGRSHGNEKPMHYNEEWPPLAATKEKPARTNEDPMQPKIKINEKINLKKFFKKEL